MEIKIVIPARMKGTRLPGKPLIKVYGKTILERVWERCIKVLDTKDVYVATEDSEILNFCNKKNIKCVKTKKAGTAIDRIKLFSDVIKSDLYINVQGDEPVFNIKDLRKLISYAKRFPRRVIFGKTKCTKKEFYDYSKAKVVCDINNKLLYSSRAGLPINNKGQYIKAERAIWLYSFYKESLDNYYNFKKKTYLEKIEDNEIIRFLEIGIDVYCIDMIGDSWAIDEKKDLIVLKNILKNEKNNNY